MDRMDPQYQKYGFNVNFDEKKSLKIKQLKKFIDSKWTIILIAFLGTVLSLTFIANVINTIQAGLALNESLGATIIYAIFGSAINLFFVILFLVLVIKLYQKRKKDDILFLYQLEVLRRYIKIYLIITLIYRISGGLVLSNLEFYYTNYRQYFNGIVFTENDLAIMPYLGYNYILSGGIYAMILYGVMKCYKLIYRRIALPRRDNELYDYFILIGILVAFGVSKIVGASLEIAGIHSFLSYYIIDFAKYGDYLLVIVLILEGLMFIYFAYYFYLVRKVLINMEDDNVNEEVIDVDFKDKDDN